MTIQTRPRQPEGIPAGGQFAATSHTEPGVALAGHCPKGIAPNRISPTGLGFDDAETNTRFVSSLSAVLGRRKSRYVVENDEFELEYGTAARIHPLPLGSEDHSWDVVRDDRGAVKIALHGEHNLLAEKELSGAELARCGTPEDAAELVAEAMGEVLDNGIGAGGGTLDGFASEADYWKWRQR